MKTAIIYPGQGSQLVGMGQDAYDQHPGARKIYETADRELAFELSNLCFSGPQDQLNLTANTQPALLTTSIALTSVLLDKLPLDVQYVAGHSLGEYSALWFSGALDFATAVKLVRLRGESMQTATPEGVGAMAAVIGLEANEVSDVCLRAAEGEVLAPANFNAPGQTVISGHRKAVERAMILAKEKGARKSILLPVSAPFHCALMKPAADIMAEALQNSPIHPLKITTICNVTAKPMSPTAESIRGALVQQITAPVQWENSIQMMVEAGVDLFLEVGPGSVLTNLAKRIAPSIKRFSISTVSDINNCIDFLSGEI